MQKLTLGILPALMISSAAFAADYLPGDLISCYTSGQISDSGYSFTVALADGRYMGSLSMNSFSGPRPLGTEEIVIQPLNVRAGKCGLRITQRNDHDRNNLRLEMSQGPDVDYTGSLSFKLDGRLSGSAVKCTVDQITYNRICKPNFSGGIYQGQGEVAPKEFNSGAGVE
jgi:hypothetical protein